MSEIKSIYQRFRQSKFFKPVLYCLGFIFLVLVFDQLIMPLYVKLGREVEMPDVLELSVQDAQAKLTENGFRVMISDSLYDSKHPGGTIIEQKPYPYAMVKKGRRVYLTVSIGERPVIMPNLFGVSPREAELILESRDLKLNGKGYVFSDIYHEGTVMGQSFPQGQPIKAGSRIDITISLGRMNQERLVPNVQGKSLYEAREILRALGLKIGQIEYEVRQDILPETVIGQSLPEGTVFATEASINLTISKEKR
jgi:beta-lactam-binding protein with PASTA domain